MSDDSWKDELNVPYRVHEQALLETWAARENAARWKTWAIWGWAVCAASAAGTGLHTLLKLWS